MATKTDLSNDSLNRAKVSLTLTESATNPNSNTSTLSWTAAVQDGNTSYGGYNYDQGSWTVIVEGVTKATATGKSYDFGSGVISSPYFPRSASGTVTVTHDSDGTAEATASIIFDGESNPAGAAATSWTSASPFVLSTFDGPGTPAAPTLTRLESSPTSIGVTSATTTSGDASITRYEYDYSTNGTSWGSNITSLGASTSGTISGLTSTQGYYVRTRAISYAGIVNGWGYGAWSPSTFKAGIPSQPGQPVISNLVTNNLTLTWTAPSTNGGATISSYRVQATTNGGANWATIKMDITSTTTNLTGLTIGATYQFRIVAINSTGYSEASDPTAELLISAYGYRYNGTTFTAITNAKIYVGIGGIGADANGWRTVENVKKYTASGWTPLET